MRAELQTAFVRRLTALADDELMLAQRNAEWTGHAPLLEEDIALSNLAQDELGHALLWYGLRRDLDGSDPDALVYFRDADAFLNAELVELPRGDWAATMLRQYLFDAYEAVLLPELERSAHPPLAAAAAKVRREERFHLRHSRLWIERLGLGTATSNSRLQRALDSLWPYAAGLFGSLPGDGALAAAGLFPDPTALVAPWLEAVRPTLSAAALAVPTTPGPIVRRGRHGPHLRTLLADLQRVARADEGASW